MFFDTHAHLADEQLAANLAAVVSRATAAGVTEILAVGTTVASSRQSIELAGKLPGVYSSAGIHPNHTAETEPGDWDTIVQLAKSGAVVALGETGLDRHWDDAPIELQRDYFDRHLALSRETGLPVIVHMRECAADIALALSAAAELGPLRGVMHSFTGDAELAQTCLDLGMYLSFAGMVTFKKSDDLRAVAAMVPADRILIETDSPYLSPHPHRGERPNEPARVVHTAACLAEVRGIPLAEFAAQTTANARRLFQLA